MNDRLTRKGVPDLHSGQINFPLGASAREMQGRWKAPQH